MIYIYISVIFLKVFSFQFCSINRTTTSTTSSTTSSSHHLLLVFASNRTAVADAGGLQCVADGHCGSCLGEGRTHWGGGGVFLFRWTRQNRTRESVQCIDDRGEE